MKIVINDDNNLIIYINKMYLKDIDFNDNLELQKYFKNILSKLNYYYDIVVNGDYELDIYTDPLYGIIIELEKLENDYFDYYDDEVELHIVIHNTNFLYELEDYFFNFKIKNKLDYYLYKNHIFVKIKMKLNEYEFGNLLEYSNINYKDNENIIKYGKLIKI